MTEQSPIAFSHLVSAITQQLQQLSQQLIERLGKGFDVTNLRNMHQFYQSFFIKAFQNGTPCVPN
jgi:flagellar biosynthesis chaperone FliJ